ncbi:HIT family protein [Methanosalsum natronophilum]|nr:HIT family protein [Methanosalsum natronophilum]MCS3924164.1 histidine triad (HIT) family protein [Methanosalsum natronophilum]
MSCLFCKIVDGKVPTNKVFEDENAIAFLDIEPATQGHTIVITKNHFDSFTTTSEDEVAMLFKTVHKVAKALEKTFSLYGMNIGTNVGNIAGQEIHHFHVHLIPRYEGDGGQNGIKSIVWTDSDTNSLDILAARIKENIN